jgi:hypothetical protein
VVDYLLDKLLYYFKWLGKKLRALLYGDIYKSTLDIAEMTLLPYSDIPYFMQVVYLVQAGIMLKSDAAYGYAHSRCKPHTELA